MRRYFSWNALAELIGACRGAAHLISDCERHEPRVASRGALSRGVGGAGVVELGQLFFCAAGSSFLSVGPNLHLAAQRGYYNALR
jgi:hypothetical protein